MKPKLAKKTVEGVTSLDQGPQGFPSSLCVELVNSQKWVYEPFILPVFVEVMFHFRELRVFYGDSVLSSGGIIWYFTVMIWALAVIPLLCSL